MIIIIYNIKLLSLIVHELSSANLNLTKGTLISPLVIVFRPVVSRGKGEI